MVSGRRYVSSSSGSSSTTSVLPAVGRFLGGGADRMVEKELEAAEALADLAHFAVRESCGGDFSSNLRRKGKRVKSKSPPPESGLNQAESAPRSSDLALQDRAAISHPRHEKVCRNLCVEPKEAEQDRNKRSLKAEQDLSRKSLKVEGCRIKKSLKGEYDHGKNSLKVEPNFELSDTTTIGTARYSSLGCGKSRRNLTEAEKEARRIRRVLANRESARQTIRRRQALCEELTKKAGNLTSENESLKREMELALREFRLLEKTNKKLKDQMAKVRKAEEEKTLSEHKPACVQIPPPCPPPANCSMLMYNHPPFAPIFWPPVSQSPNSVQAHIPPNCISMPSNIPFLPESRLDSSCKLEDPVNINGPRPPFYILPYPWYFPHPENGVPLQPPSFFAKRELDETSGNNQHNAAHSITAPHLENLRSFLPVEVKTEPHSSVEARPITDINILPGFAQDGGDQQTRFHPKERGSKETLFAPVAVRGDTVASSVKHENGLQSDTGHIESSAKVFHTPGTLPENICEPMMPNGKKVADVVAATEARKRRKELTKLKNLNHRQCRMHC
ncbi:hypothetical protein UlMin_005579 [Ulmus minor]